MSSPVRNDRNSAGFDDGGSRAQGGDPDKALMKNHIFPLTKCRE